MDRTTDSALIVLLAAVVALAAVVVGGIYYLKRTGTQPAAHLADPSELPESARNAQTTLSPPPGVDDAAATPGVARRDFPAEDLVFAEARRHMLERDLVRRDITDRRVLDAMGRVPRQLFVPESLQTRAYEDQPLPIGLGQTISQPYIVALMTQLVEPKPESRALDVGTGSGYQAAVLAELCKEVYGIEILEPLAEQAARRLRTLGYDNVAVRAGDGYRGWPEKAPFDVIIVAAAPDHVPPALVEQLAPGGRLVIPVGKWNQRLVVVEKLDDGTVRQREVAPVAFVPMTGEAEKR